MLSVNITLGSPRNGWLPFNIKVGDYSLSDEASDLGQNVIDQLIDMVINLRSNQAAECYFYLEPCAYFLKAEPNTDTTLLKVQFVDDFDSKDNDTPETLHRAQVNTHEFTNALIEALRGFRQHKFGDDDWPPPEKSDFLNTLH